MSAPNPTETVQVTSGELTLVGDHWNTPGASKGSVLLQHGGGQRRHSWKGTGERLARAGWDVWSFDARGHGDSSWAPDGDYSGDALVADLMAIRRHIGQAPVLVGASMGGITSLLAEGERGPLSPALVLVDIVATPDPEGTRRIQEFMTAAPNGFATLEEAADAISAYNPNRPRPKSLDGLKRNLNLGDDGRWHWHWDPDFLTLDSEPRRGTPDERMVAASRAVQVPTLLVRGGNSDVVSPEGFAEMQELIPHAETAEVGAAGHMIAGDDNDIFMQELVQFLDRAHEN